MHVHNFNMDNTRYHEYVYGYMYHLVWADQRPVQGNIFYISLQPGQYIVYIAREGGFFDPHFDL